MNRMIFKGLLKNTEIQICEADRREKFLEAVNTDVFDIVFLDLSTCEAEDIEISGHCADSSVIVMTSNDTDIQSGINADGFLSKPIIPEKLDEIIIRCLKNKEGESDMNTLSADEKINLLGLRLPELNTQTGLATCVGDSDFYLELLTDFCNLKIKDELTDFMNKNDHTNYCICIHGFKNSAYSVGAKALGDLSYEMEKMSREDLPCEINKLQEAFIEQYDRICTEIKRIVF